MKKITFQNLYRPGKVVIDNEFFTHFHAPETNLLYDYNDIQFKTMPTVPEFILAEEYLQDFHFRHQQNHLKFCFPDNEPLSQEIIVYLSSSGYGNCLMELYGIHPEQFPKADEVPEINIQPVTEEQLQTYLDFEYEQDVKYGTGFAEEKQGHYRRSFQDGRMMQLLAYYQGMPAGSVVVIISEEIVELDNLIVLESLRGKGIGSRLQQYVMNHFAEKIIILAADGYDTAKKMYQKQHYQFLGYRYEVLKICCEKEF
ncbi:GNAT family N-acetyltransferase [Bacillus benzoevorans]|uniref:GNAT superfamily N-acetyltransferase n=1 Tax=Bacillus benzoevorans TaxID=1456 RepID=A0A7X0LUT2_9BACI|nr:GNAT family N-acetyltransferase [Bacillus benzoevorans]MBB6445286.1 GNAT superfamily N-acetyltransferase [Bacillus benzoevorans]